MKWRDKTTVNVAKLKNELSKYLALTKKGHEIVVLEHKTPIAKVVPYNGKSDSWFVKGPQKILDLKKWLSSPPVSRSWDPVQFLLEDRKKR